MVIYFLIESWKDSDILTEADKFHPEFDKEKKKKKFYPERFLTVQIDHLSPGFESAPFGAGTWPYFGFNSP